MEDRKQENQYSDDLKDGLKVKSADIISFLIKLFEKQEGIRIKYKVIVK